MNRLALLLLLVSCSKTDPVLDSAVEGDTDTDADTDTDTDADTDADTDTDVIPSALGPEIQGGGLMMVVEVDAPPTEPLNQLSVVATDPDDLGATLTWSVVAGVASLDSGSPSASGDAVQFSTGPHGNAGRFQFRIRVEDASGNADEADVEVVVSDGIYWVDPAGDDAGPGTEADPWQTISRAAGVLVAGESVAVRTGTYLEQVEPQSSGTPAEPIVYFAPQGESPVLDGSTQLDGSPEAFRLDNTQSNVFIYGFEITNYDESVYVLGGPHTGLWIHHLDVHHNGRGLLLRALSDSVIADLTIHENDGEGLGLTDCADVRVERSDSWGNDDGAGIYGDADGFHAEACDNLVFERCRAWDNSEDAFDLTANAELHRCLAAGSQAAGIKLWVRDFDGYAPKNYVISNTIVRDNGEAGLKATNGPNAVISGSVFAHNNEQGLWIKNDDVNGVGALEIADSLIAFNGGDGLSIGASYTRTSDNNGYWGNGGTDTPETEASSVFADPLVRDAGNRDYHIDAASPLHDAGAGIAVTTDYDGLPRPAGAANDIGAYEVQE